MVSTRSNESSTSNLLSSDVRQGPGPDVVQNENIGFLSPHNAPSAQNVNGQQKEEEQQQQQAVNTHRKWIITAVVALVVVAVVAAVISKRSNNNKNNEKEAEKPSLDTFSSRPSKPVFQDQLMSLIQSHSPRTTFEDATSSQALALNWMVDRDQFSEVFTLVTERLIQRFALATLWFATGGPTTWDDDGGFGHGWLNTMSAECDWNSNDFDNCSSDGLVTSLDLTQDGLSGSLPAEMGLLSALTWLDLRNNALTGSIPSELSQLTSLIWLVLSENQLAGNVPTELVIKLTTLTTLGLWSNRLSGTIPSKLGELTTLTLLSLRDNRFTGTIPSGLGELTALTLLRLENNQFTGNIPTELGRLANPRLLWLYNNDLKGTLSSTLCNNIHPRIDCGEIVCQCCHDENGVACP